MVRAQEGQSRAAAAVSLEAALRAAASLLTPRILSTPPLSENRFTLAQRESRTAQLPGFVRAAKLATQDCEISSAGAPNQAEIVRLGAMQALHRRGLKTQLIVAQQKTATEVFAF